MTMKVLLVLILIGLILNVGITIAGNTSVPDKEEKLVATTN